MNFVKIANRLVNPSSIASAEFSPDARQPGHGVKLATADVLTLQFVGGIPAPMSLIGDEARKVWAELQALGAAPAAHLETK